MVDRERNVRIEVSRCRRRLVAPGINAIAFAVKFNALATSVTRVRHVMQNTQFAYLIRFMYTSQVQTRAVSSMAAKIIKNTARTVMASDFRFGRAVEASILQNAPKRYNPRFTTSLLCPLSLLKYSGGVFSKCSAEGSRGAAERRIEWRTERDRKRRRGNF